MRQYRMTRGWRWFSLLGGFALIGLFAWPLLQACYGHEGSYTTEQLLLIIGGSCIMITVIVMGMLDVMYSKLVIEEDRMRNYTIFGMRELNFSEIKAIEDERYIFIEPLSESKKKLRVSALLEHKEELIDWLEENFTNLDRHLTMRENLEILMSRELGSTAEQRLVKMKKIVRLTRIISVISYASIAWAFFWPVPQTWAITAVILVPVICVAVMRRYSGLIRLQIEKESRYPSLSLPIVFAAFVVMIRALQDFNLLETDTIWPQAIVVAIVFSVTIIYRNPEFNRKKINSNAMFIVIVLCMAAYGYGTVVCVNAIADRSTPDVFSTNVIERKVNSGRSYMCYLAVGPWGPFKEPNEIIVSKKAYMKIEVHDSVNVVLGAGLFSIPWYVIEAPNDTTSINIDKTNRIEEN